MRINPHNLFEATMKILDLSAGNRAIWFNKSHPDCLYIDKRKSVRPDLIADTRALPKLPHRYSLLVFDPPHMNCGRKSNMSKVYGYHTTRTILDTIAKTGSQAYQVSKPNALMAFKWNDHDIPLSRALNLMLPFWEPLFGHLTKDGPGSKTYWVMLRRKRAKLR